MNTKLSRACPQCGELTKSSWRICPVCETRLTDLTCPQCGCEVKENWRRCPECEVQLVCRQCGARFKHGQTDCYHCQPDEPEERNRGAMFRDPVCGIDFVLVRGGHYEMGDTFGKGLDNEQPVHTVALDDFYISRWPVTQAQWSILMGENPSAYQYPDHPVEQVTWSDACKFARQLSQSMNGNSRCMLPTEAQWEYAARSRGTNVIYAGGDDIDAVGWYEANSQGTSHPVGRKKPTVIGLHDMSGNVWEWCRDTFLQDAYARHNNRNPMMESSGPDRVIRGGSWNLGAWDARCARRFNFRADFYGPGLGFRLVLLDS